MPAKAFRIRSLSCSLSFMLYVDRTALPSALPGPLMRATVEANAPHCLVYLALIGDFVRDVRFRRVLTSSRTISQAGIST